VFFKLIKVHLLVSELYIHQNARCNDKKNPKILEFLSIPLSAPQISDVSFRLVRSFDIPKSIYCFPPHIVVFLE